MHRRIFNICISLAVSLTAGAQAFNPDTLVARYAMFSEYLAPEKLYLHLDRTAYCPGETIWFCGYLRNASPATIYNESNFIYVELLDKDGYAEKRVKIRRDGASFPGHINLSDDIDPGNYTVRAYTRAQMDLDPEYCFNQKVVVTGGKAREDKDAREGRDIDVSFYPEGGRIFNGIPVRVGFKVMDSRGRSVDAEGRITNGHGDTVAQISTRFDGMGSFGFIPIAGEDYFCELSPGGRFPLPTASSEGASVAIQELQGRRMISAAGVSGGPYSILIRDAVQTRHLADINADGSVRRFFLPDDTLAEGINHLLLLDAGGRIVSQRLFFKYPEKEAGASVSFKDERRATRVPVTMRLDLAGADDATCSVSVLRSSLAGCRQDDGIDSYMLLSSELRGRINEPRHYFDPAVPARTRAADVDLLMMVQGWTYYDMAQIADPKSSLGGEKKRHFREYIQEIRGKVTRSLSSKIPEKFLLAFMIPSLGRTSITPVESGSNFVIDSLDFEEGTGMIIKIARMGRGMDYAPSWDGEEFAKEFKYFPAPGFAGIQTEKVDVVWSDPADTLKAAVITADAGTVNLGVAGRELPKSDLKIHGFMSLVDYVRMKTPFYYDGQYMRNRRMSLLGIGGGGGGGDEEDGPTERTSEDGWDESPVKLVVNGSIAAWEAFADITLSELKSISITTQADVIYNARDGVVAIQLDDGASVTHLGADDTSLVYFTPLGYQPPQQFYSPRYDRGEYTGDPDKRNTIFWDPSVKVRNGHAEVTFCTTGEESWPFAVHVEGMTAEGEPFSCSGTCLKSGF